LGIYYPNIIFVDCQFLHRVNGRVSQYLIEFLQRNTAGYANKKHSWYAILLTCFICIYKFQRDAGRLCQPNWLDLRQLVAIFIFELGANDRLHGITPAESIKNLDTIIEWVDRKYSDSRVISAGIQLPPSLGYNYSRQFCKCLQRLPIKMIYFYCPLSWTEREE